MTRHQHMITDQVTQHANTSSARRPFLRSLARRPSEVNNCILTSPVQTHTCQSPSQDSDRICPKHLPQVSYRSKHGLQGTCVLRNKWLMQSRSTGADNCTLMLPNIVPPPPNKLWQLSTACPDQGAYMATAGVVLISLQSKVVLLSSKRQ